MEKYLRPPTFLLCPAIPRVPLPSLGLSQVEKDSELLLIIKTRHELLVELTTFVRANHPYDEPEVVALPILGGSSSYLQWLMDNTRAAVVELGSEISAVEIGSDA